ncbi:MAG: hypothetical protein JXA10_16465 [Anaerolineae bacterium]|nr:hypothetical protein [Anaerolineae bacterium]
MKTTSNMDAELLAVTQAIRAGNKGVARDMLRRLLRENPSADAWYLAAQLAPTVRQRIQYLNKALEFDPFYEAAAKELEQIHRPIQATQHPLRKPRTLGVYVAQIALAITLFVFTGLPGLWLIFAGLILFPGAIEGGFSALCFLSLLQGVIGISLWITGITIYRFIAPRIG